jgi:hypothetical protein
MASWRHFRRGLCTFYDSQSGRHVTIPTSFQCHLSLRAVAKDRTPSALRHVIKGGSPARGLASVMQAFAEDESGVSAAADDGHSEVCAMVSNRAQGVATLEAARGLNLRTRAVLLHQDHDPHNVSLFAAEMADAGAETILLSASASLDQDQLREIAEAACEVDLVGMPMHARLGLWVANSPNADPLRLVRFAHTELGLLHFAACLAGVQAPRPSELLKAVGVRAADASFGPIFLAEHVPDAA